MNLLQAQTGIDYIVKDINVDDDELKAFLFSLGCYSGETVNVVSKKRRNLVLAIKDARYNIDAALAEAVSVQLKSEYLAAAPAS